MYEIFTLTLYFEQALLSCCQNLLYADQCSTPFLVKIGSDRGSFENLSVLLNFQFKCNLSSAGTIYASSAVNCLPSYIHISTALSLLWYGSNVCFSKAGAQSKAFEQCNVLQNAPISMQFYLDEALLPASPFLHIFNAKTIRQFLT